MSKNQTVEYKSKQLAQRIEALTKRIDHLAQQSRFINARKESSITSIASMIRTESVEFVNAMREFNQRAKGCNKHHFIIDATSRMLDKVSKSIEDGAAVAPEVHTIKIGLKRTRAIGKAATYSVTVTEGHDVLPKGNLKAIGDSIGIILPLEAAAPKVEDLSQGLLDKALKLTVRMRALVALSIKKEQVVEKIKLENVIHAITQYAQSTHNDLKAHVATLFRVRWDVDEHFARSDEYHNIRKMVFGEYNPVNANQYRFWVTQSGLADHKIAINPKMFQQLQEIYESTTALITKELGQLNEQIGAEKSKDARAQIELKIMGFNGDLKTLKKQAGEIKYADGETLEDWVAWMNIYADIGRSTQLENIPTTEAVQSVRSYLSLLSNTDVREKRKVVTQSLGESSNARRLFEELITVAGYNQNCHSAALGGERLPHNPKQDYYAVISAQMASSLVRVGNISSKSGLVTQTSKLERILKVLDRLTLFVAEKKSRASAQKSGGTQQQYEMDYLIEFLLCDAASGFTISNMREQTIAYKNAIEAVATIAEKLQNDLASYETSIREYKQNCTTLMTHYQTASIADLKQPLQAPNIPENLMALPAFSKLDTQAKQLYAQTMQTYQEKKEALNSTLMQQFKKIAGTCRQQPDHDSANIHKHMKDIQDYLIEDSAAQQQQKMTTDTPDMAAAMIVEGPSDEGVMTATAVEDCQMPIPTTNHVFVNVNPRIIQQLTKKQQEELGSHIATIDEAYWQAEITTIKHQLDQNKYPDAQLLKQHFLICREVQRSLILKLGNEYSSKKLAAKSHYGPDVADPAEIATQLDALSHEKRQALQDLCDYSRYKALIKQLNKARKSQEWIVCQKQTALNEKISAFFRELLTQDEYRAIVSTSHVETPLADTAEGSCKNQLSSFMSQAQAWYTGVLAPVIQCELANQWRASLFAFNPKNDDDETLQIPTGLHHLDIANDQLQYSGEAPNWYYTLTETYNTAVLKRIIFDIQAFRNKIETSDQYDTLFTIPYCLEKYLIMKEDRFELKGFVSQKQTALGELSNLNQAHTVWFQQYKYRNHEKLQDRIQALRVVLPKEWDATHKPNEHSLAQQLQASIQKIASDHFEKNTLIASTIGRHTLTLPALTDEAKHELEQSLTSMTDSTMRIIDLYHALQHQTPTGSIRVSLTEWIANHKLQACMTKSDASHDDQQINSEILQQLSEDDQQRLLSSFAELKQSLNKCNQQYFTDEITRKSAKLQEFIRSYEDETKEHLPTYQDLLDIDTRIKGYLAENRDSLAQYKIDHSSVSVLQNKAFGLVAQRAIKNQEQMAEQQRRQEAETFETMPAVMTAQHEGCAPDVGHSRTPKRNRSYHHEGFGDTKRARTPAKRHESMSQKHEFQEKSQHGGFDDVPIAMLAEGNHPAAAQSCHGKPYQDGVTWNATTSFFAGAKTNRQATPAKKKRGYSASELLTYLVQTNLAITRDPSIGDAKSKLVDATIEKALRKKGTGKIKDFFVKCFLNANHTNRHVIHTNISTPFNMQRVNDIMHKRSMLKGFAGCGSKQASADVTRDNTRQLYLANMERYAPGTKGNDIKRAQHALREVFKL